jgi:hypothetical protein
MRQQSRRPASPKPNQIVRSRARVKANIWSQPSSCHHCGLLPGYRISWEEYNRTNTRVTHYLPNVTLEYRVTGLTALTTYTIEVAAMTSKGQGQVSASTISSGVPPGRCLCQGDPGLCCSCEQHLVEEGPCLAGMLAFIRQGSMGPGSSLEQVWFPGPLWLWMEASGLLLSSLSIVHCIAEAPGGHCPGLICPTVPFLYHAPHWAMVTVIQENSHCHPESPNWTSCARDGRGRWA